MVLGFRKRGTDLEPEVTESPAEASGVEANENIESSLDQLQKFKATHQWDFNLSYDEIEAVNKAAESDDVEKKANLEHTLLEEDSPYFEVRSSVRNYDVEMPSNTLRVWLIGMIATTLVSGANMLFSLRNPTLNIYVYVVQLLAYPVGVFLAKILPDKEFNVFGWKFNLSPGPFNLKEHTVIVMMANVSNQGGAAYATDVLLAQQVMYGQSFGWGFQLLLTITTQALGFSMAGIVRRWLIWPAAMIWPQTLANAQLMYALHDHSSSDPNMSGGWTVGRYRFFLLVFLGSFCWYWIPGYLAQGLSYFNWICWIAPQNVLVNQIFGNYTGFGILPITFDWTNITAWMGSPLVYPLFTIANTMFGVIVFFLFVGLGIKYQNVWWQKYLPIASDQPYDNTAQVYNVSRILTPQLTLDVDAYQSYSPLLLGTYFTLCYGVSFGALSSIIVHTFIYHGKEIWERGRLARNQDADIHLKMMRKYPDTPNWWYLALFVILFALSLFTVLYYETLLTWWAMIVAFLLATVFLVPFGMVQGISNYQLGLNVLTEFMIGYMLPGRPLAMMIFKTYGYISMSQGLYFLQDMKLAHYMKVPPKITFMAQLVATIWAAIVQVCVFNWALGNIPDICSPDQKNDYTCPGASVFYTASVVWGVVGPARMFGAGGIYANMQWYWLLGAALPIITFYAAKKWPRSFIRYIHWPIIFAGNGNIPPATIYIYLCWGSVGMIFNGIIKRKWKMWWGRYNYIMSAGLDTGLYISTIVIFFALILPQKVNQPQWFLNPPADGNPNISNAFNNLDTWGEAILATLGPNETIGPATWS